MVLKGWLHIESDEKFLLLKLMNGLYGISLAENAVNTQKFLSKIILFFKYYAAEDNKLIRLKEELDTLRLFIELMTVSSGNQRNISLNISDTEILNLYIPSNTLLLLIMSIFLNAGDTAAETKNVWVQISQKEEVIVISIENMILSDTNKLRATVEDLKKSFKLLSDSTVNLVLDYTQPEAAKIIIIIPVENSL